MIRVEYSIWGGHWVTKTIRLFGILIYRSDIEYSLAHRA